MRRGFILNNCCAKRQGIWGAQRRSLGTYDEPTFYFFSKKIAKERKCRKKMSHDSISVIFQHRHGRYQCRKKKGTDQKPTRWELIMWIVKWKPEEQRANSSE